MEFQKLGAPERKLLLSALELDRDNLKCQQCKERVDYKTCCIMPPLKTKLLATILCDSPLCMAEYLSSLEADEEKIKAANQERKKKIIDLRARIDKLQYKLNEVTSTCPHEITQRGMGAHCDICGNSFGWWCPKSESHLCEYKDDEWCIHCGEPSERK